MKIEENKLTLKAKVVEGFLEGALYIKDDLNSTSYPGMLELWKIPWKVGDELKITIERIQHEPHQAS